MVGCLTFVLHIVAGDIDFERGIVRVSYNLGWKNVPLKALLQKQLKCQVNHRSDIDLSTRHHPFLTHEAYIIIFNFNGHTSILGDTNSSD